MMPLRLAAGFHLGGQLPIVLVDHDDYDDDQDDDDDGEDDGDSVEARGGVPLGR